MLKKFLMWVRNYKTCPQCGGTGKYFSEGMARDQHCNKPLPCPMCLGNGEIKRK